MEPHNNNSNISSGDVDTHFTLGKSDKNDKDKKKTKKPEEVAEQRIKDTFNIAAGSSKENDELKRKREDYAVQLRKKNRYITIFSISCLILISMTL